ncbi:hypothetical protein B0H11DRAFT_2204812 [Mycena galericulata]|nr:hypothetical protein B0H11DRAFT_2204812 [Mycena galericulata]
MSGLLVSYTNNFYGFFRLICVPLDDGQKRAGNLGLVESNCSEAGEPVLLGMVGKPMEGTLKTLETHDEVVNHLAVQSAAAVHRVRSTTAAEGVSNRAIGGALVGEAVRNGIAESTVCEMGRDTPVLGSGRGSRLDSGVDMIGNMVTVGTIGLVLHGWVKLLKLLKPLEDEQRRWTVETEEEGSGGRHTTGATEAKQDRERRGEVATCKSLHNPLELLHLGAAELGDLCMVDETYNQSRDNDVLASAIDTLRNIIHRPSVLSVTSDIERNYSQTRNAGELDYEDQSPATTLPLGKGTCMQETTLRKDEPRDALSLFDFAFKYHVLLSFLPVQLTIPFPAWGVSVLCSNPSYDPGVLNIPFSVPNLCHPQGPHHNVPERFGATRHSAHLRHRLLERRFGSIYPIGKTSSQRCRALRRRPTPSASLPSPFR